MAHPFGPVAAQALMGRDFASRNGRAGKLRALSPQYEQLPMNWQKLTIDLVRILRPLCGGLAKDTGLCSDRAVTLSCPPPTPRMSDPKPKGRQPELQVRMPGPEGE